jgi:N-hydroxyarylamine O-acetyltransferase
MQLSDYLLRIGYQGDVQPDLDSLIRIHRFHALNIPYENLDVQLERPLDQNIERIFQKIVTNRRGGWCYEQNGLLEWVLREIGFEVTRVVGGMERREGGNATLGNHLVLLVHLDRTYIADLGVGDGSRIPLPLVEGTHEADGLIYRLERIEDDYWRFHNHSFAVPTSFDFRQEPADEKLIAQVCHELQVSPDSTFVQNFVAQIMRKDSITCLTGKVMRHKTSSGSTKTILGSALELEHTLGEVFGIEDPEIKSIWPKIETRHAALFGERTLDQIDDSDIEF